jgi:hypothetical protein
LKSKAQDKKLSMRRLSKFRGSHCETTLEQFFVTRPNCVTTCLDLSPNADRMIVGGTDRYAAVYVVALLNE